MPRRRPRRSDGWRGIQSLVFALVLAGAAIGVIQPSDKSLEGRAHVVDGDTLRIGETRIRLKGIDAPEREQACRRSGQAYPCGETARKGLIALVAGKEVRCRSSGRDRYGRVLARCAVEGQDLGARMVEEGHAVSYNRDYDREEARARSRAAGLWSGTFERPQDWRRSRQEGQ